MGLFDKFQTKKSSKDKEQSATVIEDFLYVIGLSDDVFDKRVVELRDAFFEKLIKAKPKYDSIKPSENIDLALEEKIKI